MLFVQSQSVPKCKVPVLKVSGTLEVLLSGENVTITDGNGVCFAPLAFTTTGSAHQVRTEGLYQI